MDSPILPLPVDASATFVVLFGGTFDPPHRGHVELPARARDELERKSGEVEGWVVFMPAARSPHKQTGPVASDADRIAMLQIAARGIARAGVWADEIERSTRANAPSYTVDSVRRARAWLDQHGRASCELRLLIGADQALAFHRWREPRELVRLAPPVVMLRPPVSTREQFQAEMRSSGAWSDDELRVWEDSLVDVGVMDLAATDVRKSLAEGSPVDAGVLDPGVNDYIRQHGLYRVD